MSQHDHDRASAPFPPVRWVEAAATPPSAESDDVERRIGALIARLPAPAAFNADAQARVAGRLRPSSPRQDGAGRGWSRRRLALGLSFGTAVLLLSGVVIAGGGVRVWWNRLRAEHPASLVASREAATRLRHPRQLTTTPARNDLGASDVGSEDVGSEDVDRDDGRDLGPPMPAAAAAPSPPAQLPQPEPQETARDVPSAAGGKSAAAAPQHALPRPRRRVLASRQLAREGSPAVAPPAGGQVQPAPAGPVPPAEAGPSSVPPAVEPAPLPAPSSSWMPAPDPAPRPARGAPTAALPPPPPSQLSQEAQLLNVAMVQLRQRRDGAAALATLNDYVARYPRGMLADEARGARIDALLLLQRKNDALRALEAARLEPVGRGQELLVIRGELRARRDCGSAIRDFELVLERAAPAPLQERALFGRAVCRRRQGDEQGARADADAYLTRFPAGRFEASVRRLADGDPRRTP